MAHPDVGMSRLCRRCVCAVLNIKFLPLLACLHMTACNPDIPRDASSPKNDPRRPQVQDRHDWVASTQPTDARAQHTSSLWIDAPRPMAEAALIISARFGVAVTYEDPPFVFGGDLRPIIPDTEGYVPRNISENITYSGADTILQVLESATATHNATGQGGSFAVVGQGGVWGLVPKASLGKTGRVLGHRSILDERLSLQVREGDTCEAVLKGLLTELARRHPEAHVLAGRIPRGLMSRLAYSGSKDVTTARAVLDDMLRLLNDKMPKGKALFTWQLRYAPASGTEKPMWSLQYQGIEVRPTKPFLIRIEDVRPMARAVEIVQRCFPVMVTYEEPAYQCPCDVMGRPGTGRAALAGAMIEIEWDASQNSPEQILSLLVGAPLEPRDPSHMFAVERVTENRYHIYPVKARDAKGELTSRYAHMDKRIDTQALRGSIGEVAERCAALALGSATVKVGTSAASDTVAKVIQETSPEGFPTPSMRARDALDYCLRSIQPGMSWQLLFNPATARHELELYAVRALSNPGRSNLPK